MIKIDWSEKSTWRGAAMFVAGTIGFVLLVPVVIEIFNATSSEQVKFALEKSTAIAGACMSVGQTVSGLIGIIFSDKGQVNV